MVRPGFTLGFAATWVHTGNPPGTIQALVVRLCRLSGPLR
jgi:hypothetical protein